MKTLSLEQAMRTKHGLQMLIIRHAAGRCDATALKHMVAALSFYEKAEDEIEIGEELGCPRQPLDRVLNCLGRCKRSACFSGACEENSDELRTINGIIETLSVYVYGDPA